MKAPLAFPILFAILTDATAKHHYVKHILALSREFLFNKIQLACPPDNLEAMNLLFKNLFVTSSSMGTLSETKSEHIFICTEELALEDINMVPKLSTVYVLGNHTELKAIIDVFSTDVGQKVFYISIDYGDVTEAYSVGQAKVINVIGTLVPRENQTDLHYVKAANISSNILERRRNLNDQVLAGITEKQVPYMIHPGSTVRDTEDGWVKTNRGDQHIKDITNEELSGLLYDTLEILQQNMNFTLKYVLLKEFDFKSFGYLENGTWTGLIGLAVNGDVDMMAASVTLTSDRYDAVDFALPLGEEQNVLYVQRGELARREWLAFLYPLRKETWIFLLFNTIILLVSLKFFQSYYFGMKGLFGNIFKSAIDTVGDFWILGCSYFGGKPSNDAKEQKAIRMLIFFVFLSGNFAFMGYKASLTAELNAKRYALPFTNVDELLETDYKVIHYSHIETFPNAQSRDRTSPMVQLINEKIVHQNDAGVYYEYDEMLNELATSTEPTAAFFEKGVLSGFPEYHCKIAEAYKFPQPSYVSLAFPKSSPYTELFRYELLKMSEQGILDILNQEHTDIKTQCEELATDTPLSMVKLSSLFGILATGMACSIIMVIFEALFRRNLIEMSAQGQVGKFIKVGVRIGDGREDEIQRFLFKWGKQGQDAFIMDLHRLMNMKKGKDFC